jgi:hypothetical protein
MKLLLAVLLLQVSCVFAQSNAFENSFYSNFTLETEPTEITDSVKPHSIRKAVILSACLPGAGQVYNHLAMPKGKKKAFWKVPLIYAGLGASTYFLITNQHTQKELKQEYTNRIELKPGAAEWAGYDDQGVLTLYNQYLNWRDLSIVAVGIVYLLQVTDAGVEAHFVNFDVSEDLSMGFDPVILDYRTPGLKLSLNFR